MSITNAKIQLISVPEACTLLNISPKTGWAWLTHGKFPLPTAMIHGRRVVRMSDVVSYVDNLFSPAANQPVYASNVELTLNQPEPELIKVIVTSPAKRPRGRPRLARNNN